MKHPWKFICLLTLSLLLGLGWTKTASAAGFSDVPAGHWAYDSIMEMEQRGIVEGSGGRFRPSESVSNQAFLAMVCRATGMDDRTLESSWSANPIMAYGSFLGWFDPETELTHESRALPITREFAAKLLVKAFFPDMAAESKATDFTDWDFVGKGYRSYVRVAAELGLIGGYPDGSFRPQGTLTRAAAAALINRAIALQTQPVGKTVQVPILMYHDVSYLGHGYSKTPEVFRKQMEELKAAGFQTVFFSDVVDFVDSGKALPEKPIVITFDDGYMSNYTYVFPILRQLDMKAEISLIGDAMEYTEWGLKWKTVREMQKSGLVRFQAHTTALHDAAGRTGVLKKADESWEEYVQLFARDTKNIQTLLIRETDSQPLVFTYPLGKHNPVTEAVVRQTGFRASLTTLDGVAKITHGKPESLYLMNRIGMDFRNGSVLETLKQFGYQG